MRLLQKLIFATLTVTIVFMLNGCAEQVEKQVFNKPAIEIIEPRLRLMPTGVRNTAGFMTIQNNSGKPLILKGASADWAKHTMLHQSRIEEGMAKMTHLDELLIEEVAEFNPGGSHIMIMGSEKPFVKGESHNILLHFEGMEPIAVSFKVGEAIN